MCRRIVGSLTGSYCIHNQMISYPWTRDRGHLVAVTVQEKEHRLKYFDLGVEVLPVFTSFLVVSMVRLLDATGFTKR